jgi:hypothetical protein
MNTSNIRVTAKPTRTVKNRDTILPPIFKDTIVLEITDMLSRPIDNARLLTDIDNAVKAHAYTRRTPVWLSVPLRSVNGDIGEKASDSVGIYNSADGNLYKDTPAMQPYIKELINELGVQVLKVRILNLKSKESIAEHVDNFQSNDVVRLHIPVVTHPSVEFWLDGDRYYIPTNKLYYLNVRKKHKVYNGSNNDRVHIVIDVVQTPELADRVIASAKIVEPLY